MKVALEILTSGLTKRAGSVDFEHNLILRIEDTKEGRSENRDSINQLGLG
jgi:hypothetical protein